MHATQKHRPCDCEQILSTQFGAHVNQNTVGGLYLPLTGEVVVLKDDGTYDHIAWVPSKEESGKDLIGLGGLDKADNIYVVDKAHSKYDEEDLTNPFHPGVPGRDGDSHRDL